MVFGLIEHGSRIPCYVALIHRYQLSAYLNRLVTAMFILQSFLLDWNQNSNMIATYPCPVQKQNNSYAVLLMFLLVICLLPFAMNDFVSGDNQSSSRWLSPSPFAHVIVAFNKMLIVAVSECITCFGHCQSYFHVQSKTLASYCWSYCAKNYLLTTDWDLF